MVSEGFLETLQKSLEEGKVSMSQIDNAVRLILEAKYDLGLFRNPYKNCDENRAKTEIFTQENRQFARKVAAESMVLLKNQNQVLPLKKSGTIAVIGPLANTKENMAGTWTLASKQDQSISVLDGLQTVVGDQVQFVYAKGSNLDYDAEFQKIGTMFKKEIPRDNRSPEELIQEALDVTKNADVILAVLGESAEMSGESSSRTQLEIPQAQQDVLAALLKTGKPVVLVLFTGRPLVLVEENTKVPAILNVWFPGSEAGLAIADVLFGDVVPSGKLTATWPRSVGQIPIYYNYKNTGRPLGNKEGKFEKYKSNYIDERNEPLYPFGFGLSYTQFEYGPVKVSSNTLTKNGSLTVSVEVKNVGNFDAKEVVQLYTRDLVGSITRPVKELKGFQKVEIKKGETKTVSFTITENDLKFYNQELDFKSEVGTFEVFVGTNSETTNSTTFELID
jgi:beta-glucosidase